MGQAFRRATGRLRNTGTIPSPSAPPRNQNSLDRRPPPPPPSDGGIHVHKRDSTEDSNSKTNVEVLLEERDPSYEAMLSKMVGKINTKPGGKLEMGEAYVVQKTTRPLPKVRNTTPDTGRYEERPAAAGTLNVAQLRHIMLLHQGKGDERDGPLGLKEVADRFRVDAVQLEKIFQHVSLPPEGNTTRNINEPVD